LGLVAILWTAACSAKTEAPTLTPVATPDPVVEDQLADRLARLSARLEQARVEHHVPGMALVIVKDDAIIFAEGFGFADLETQRPVTPETLFAIGSSTKAFTAALVAMQVDAGKLGWDDPIAQHVPELQLRPRVAEAGDGSPPQPSLRDMLCHRSGFTRMALLWASGDLALHEALTVASGAEPVAEFRQSFLYNNVTFASAGEAAARTAGTTWAQLVHDRLLEPLAMTSTNLSVSAAQADSRLAQGYRWREISEVHEALPMRSLDTIAPAGAINSNVLDMAQWLRLQLGRGSLDGNQLISAEHLEHTWTPQIDMGGRLHYGLGWMLGDWQGHRVVEHGGNIDGYAATVAMLPDQGLGFVLLTNISASPLQRASMGLVFDALLNDPPADEDPGELVDLQPYVGRYIANFGPFNNADFSVTAEGNTLYVDVPNQTRFELRPPNEQGRWVFATTDTIEVAFDLDAEGKGQVLHLFQNGLDFELPRHGYIFPAELTIEEATPMLGLYRAEVPAPAVTVRLEGGRLVADVEGQMPFVLRKPDHGGRWQFRAKPDLAVSFRTDAKGKIDALLFHHEGSAELAMLRTEASAVAPLPSVAQLLEAAKADAFTRRLEQLGTVEITGKVRMTSSNIEGRFRTVFDHQGHRRLEFDLGRYGHVIETFDGASAWTVSNIGPPSEAQGKYLRQAQLASPFLIGDWTRGFDEARVDSRVGVGKDERVLVILQVEGLPHAKFYVDPKTGDVTAAEQTPLAEATGPIASKTELSDFRKVLGLRLPHHLSTRNEHTGVTSLEVESVKQLHGDTAALFSRPDAP